MDERFALSRGHAYTLVFQYAAEAAHGMALEMGKVYQEVIVGDVAADTVKLYVGVVLYRYVHAPFFVHDVNRRYLGEAAFFYGAAMARGVRAVALICCIAFNDCAVHFIHKPFDEFRAEIIRA